MIDNLLPCQPPDRTFDDVPTNDQPKEHPVRTWIATQSRQALPATCAARTLDLSESVSYAGKPEEHRLGRWRT